MRRSRVEEWLTGIDPAVRRRAAVHGFTWTAAATPVNVALYAAGVINEAALILITLTLSWLALTLTFADLVATTDVRAETDQASSVTPSPDG